MLYANALIIFVQSNNFNITEPTGNPALYKNQNYFG